MKAIKQCQVTTLRQERKRWLAMISRCHHLKDAAYPKYGGVGITVCQRWRDSFDAYCQDMECPRPAGMTIERKDGTKGYSPENCVWATYAQQNRNLKTNLFLEHNGKRMVIADWAEEVGIPPSTIATRIYCRHWSTEKALTTSIHGWSPNAKMLTFNGETLRLSKMAEKYGIKRQVIQDRLKAGWSIEKALTTTIGSTQHFLMVTYKGETLKASEMAKKHGVSYNRMVERITQYGWSPEKA